MQNVAEIKQFGGVIITSIAICIEYFLIMQIAAGSARRKHFTKDFLNEHFGTDHHREFGTQIAKGGYPDHGSGRYSEKLSYKGWVEFNNAMRVHYNYLELLTSILFSLIIAGMVYPYAAIIEGCLYMIARIIYTIGYLSQRGARGRVIGAIFGWIVWGSIYITAGLSVLKIAKAY